MPLVPLRQFKAPRQSGAARTAQLGSVPAPIGGLNYYDPISNMPLSDASVLRNFIPRRSGVDVRAGWKYHTASLGSAVSSLFAYNASNPDDSKLFAAANSNIYDVTTDTPVVSQASTGSTEDLWSTTQFANGAGNYLLAVSPGAGYWTYDGSTWTQRTPTNLPANPTSVAVFKNRVWFTVENSSTVYYMNDVDAIDGTVTGFEMGSLLRNGGYVRGLINWTVDAAYSIDDMLVVVGSEGDIGIWQGTDPTSATTFALRGVWYVGPVPKYGRFFTSFGGDVMLISDLGLVPMSKLIAGQFSEVQPGPALKVQQVLSPIIRDRRLLKSWDVSMVPSADILLIKLPPKLGIYTQYAMNVNSGAWCTLSDMPIVCGALLNGSFYFATSTHEIARGFYGEYDGADIDGTGGTVIEAEVQGAFNAFQMPGSLKKFSAVRPIFTARVEPAFKVAINTQFSYVAISGSPALVVPENSTWDNGSWNVATWSASLNTYQSWAGVTGLGYYGALRMKIRALGGSTTLAGYDVMVAPGGIL